MRRFKKTKKELEILPTFLKNIPLRSKKCENELVATKRNDEFRGPIFFGEYEQHHPPPHRLPLDISFIIHLKEPSKENLLSNIFVVQQEPPIKIPKSTLKVVQPPKKLRVMEHPWPHHCPGTLKRATHKVVPKSSPELGQTISNVQGQTAREIHTLFEKSNASRLMQQEHDANISKENRAAHFHVKKELKTITRIGPVIPGAFTIQKLSRDKENAMDLEVPLECKAQDEEAKAPKQEEQHNQDLSKEKKVTMQEFGAKNEEEGELENEIEK